MSRRGLFLCIHLLSLVLVSTQQNGGRLKCRLRSGKHGVCIPLHRCPSLKEQYSKSHHGTMMNQYRCEVHGKTSLVCCPPQYREGTIKKPPKHRPPMSKYQDIAAGAPRNDSKHQNRRLLPESVCGRFLGDKILGGTTADLDEFPWMALLQYNVNGVKTFGCGGSLISDRYVLTAAHCIKGPGPPNMVRLGEFDTSKARDCQGATCSPPPLDVPVEKVVVHRNYKPRLVAQYDDIALIRLRRKVNFSTFVMPICLPLDETRTKSFEGQELVVAGWGRTTNDKGSQSNTKQKLSVPVISMEQCTPFYKKNNVRLRNTQICAGGETNKDSCSGDSGGPLMSAEVVGSEVRWVVVGVVSFGPKTCGLENVAGVYTKVSQYSDWILDNMKP